jgi:hypothetical protein
MGAKLAVTILIEVILLLTVCLGQQTSLVADPEAERILDKAAQAEGRDSVLGTLRTLRLRGSMYWGSSHMVGDVEAIIQFPDKFRDSFTTNDGNTQLYGFDGTEAWKRSSPRESLTELPRLQLLLPAAQWRLRYIAAKFVGQRKIGNHQAYVIRALVRGQNSPADYYYDPVNYLLLQVDVAKPLPITYRVSGFHDVEGLEIPREWTFRENRTVIASLKLNIDIDDKEFARPK